MNTKATKSVLLDELRQRDVLIEQLRAKVKEADAELEVLRAKQESSVRGTAEVRYRRELFTLAREHSQSGIPCIVRGNALYRVVDDYMLAKIKP